MSRKIKFRAWGVDPNLKSFADEIKNEKEMFQVDTYLWEEWGHSGTNFTGDCLPDEVDDLMQYTGIDSIDGLEIYEGDIVYIVGSEENQFGVVEWNEESADYEVLDANWNFIKAFGISGDKYYKLGNKYENKDFLTELRVD